MSRFSTYLLCSILILSTSAIAKLPIEAGLWEVTRKTDLSQAGLPDMSEMMKNLPPEAQAQVKKMMKQQGQGTTSPGVKTCVTKEDIEMEKIPQEEDCETKITSRKKNEFVYKFNCKKSKAQGEAVITAINSKHYRSQMNMTSSEDGQKRTIKMTLEGKWLSKDCGEHAQK